MAGTVQRPTVAADKVNEWFALFRGEETKWSAMVVAWWSSSDRDDEVASYARWDASATGTSRWRIASFYRTERAVYHRRAYVEKKFRDDLEVPEYHYVREDYEAAAEEGSVRWTDWKRGGA